MALNKRWRRNPFDANTVNSVLITEEEHIIEFHEEPNAYGFYANEGILLDANDPVVLVQDNTAQTAFTEIPRTIAPSSGQFRVDYDEDGYYNTGFVQCNSSDNGKTVLFTYRGTGTLVHPTFRPLTEFNYPGTIHTDGGLSVDGSVILADATGATISVSNKRINDLATPFLGTDAAQYSQVEQLARFMPWDARAISEPNEWMSAAYAGNGLFAAVAKSGTNRAAYSTNYGLTWTVTNAGAANEWRSVAYGDGVFVAVASTGTNRVTRSANGINWSTVSSAVAAANDWVSVAYGDGVFVAVASGSSTGRIMRSIDGGLTWSAITGGVDANSWGGVTYGDGVFVAVAGSGSQRIARSTDGGVTWSLITAPEANSWYAVAYGNGVFMAVANAVSGSLSMYSTNAGVTWQVKAMPAQIQWLSIVYAGTDFVAIAPSGDARIARLIDADTTGAWVGESHSIDSTWAGLSYGDGFVVALATVGTVRIARKIQV